LAFISSKVPEDLLKTDILISSDEEGFEASGLRISSVIHLHRLMTAATTIIRRELGQLSEAQKENVKSKLKILFELE